MVVTHYWRFCAYKLMNDSVDGDADSDNITGDTL